MNFLSLYVIAQIDNLFASTLHKFEVFRQIESDHFKNLIFEDNSRDLPVLKKLFSPLTVFSGIIRIFYSVYYYYFMAFTAIFLTFLQSFFVALFSEDTNEIISNLYLSDHTLPAIIHYAQLGQIEI